MNTQGLIKIMECSVNVELIKKRSKITDAWKLSIFFNFLLIEGGGERRGPLAP